MAFKMEVSGFIGVEQELAEALANSGNPANERLIYSILQGISQHTVPFVPVDTSDLVNSEVRKVVLRSGGFEGTIEYTAEYAGYVHDGGPKNWQKPGASDKFLERGVKEFIAEDLQGVLDRYG